MRLLKRMRILTLTAAIVVVCAEVGERLSIPGIHSVIPASEARLGRPLTPVSVAGVARRTTRRAIRRSTVYIAALPRGCTTVVVSGATLSQCGGTYYQPYNNQYVVVYID